MTINDIGTKTENGGLTAAGRLSAEEFNTLLAHVRAMGDPRQKFGAVDYRNGTFRFYDEEGGTVLGSVILSGTMYTIQVSTNLGQVFSVLTSEASKELTISGSTQAGQLGQDFEFYPEGYTYVVSIDSGSGYLPRFSGAMGVGEQVSVDIRPYLAVGTNRLRVTLTGQESEQTKTSILTATLTSLSLSCNHGWQVPWEEGSSYTLGNIFIAGSLEKTLHVRVGETELTRVLSGSENYTTIPTSFTLPASLFPAGESSQVVGVDLWLTGDGVETSHVGYNIMCRKTGDDTPMVCINAIAAAAVNFTQGTLFEYATLNADRVVVAALVEAGGETYDLGSMASNVATGERGSFATSLEVNTQAETGVFKAYVTPYKDDDGGSIAHVVMPLDNSHAYLAQQDGLVVYVNAALRNNGEADRESFVNAVEAATDKTFPGIHEGYSWSNDGWGADADGNRAWVAPAGCKSLFPTLRPLADYQNGMTVEMVVRSSNIADYDTPVLSMVTENASGNQEGFILYPTKVVVLGTDEQSVVTQSVGLCEDTITHLALTLQGSYGGKAGYNLASLYVNGIPNVSFEFGGTSHFGAGGLQMGQGNTDFCLYMMRVYDRALEGGMVFANMLNAVSESMGFNRQLLRDRNDIIEGTQVEYSLAKARGYNCMVIEPVDDQDDIPSFTNQKKVRCSVRFEYGDHPEWNVTIENIDGEGQGTTSMQYDKWNIRGKTTAECTWVYADGTRITGKLGYMDGGPSGGVHRPIERFTAKKNIASSMQGHKIGATALYDDLFAELGLKKELPSEDYRVAVWQYPFLGFRKYSNGTYEFIGLYTVGPDKGCKSTFGYDKALYPKAMCLEGPNHDPRGTRFLHPWVDVTYSSAAETLQFGGEEGWDDDFSSVGSSDKADDEPKILACYEEEWKPAYELVYHCSPYIASIAETGFASIAAINADITGFFRGTTNGRSNELMSLYDENYDLWFYRNKTRQFENLSTVEGGTAHNVKTYLGLSGRPATAEIIAARVAKFKAEMTNYFSQDQALAHKCIGLLIAAKDNDAKNTYPQKHLALSEGGRWGWKQDDLDSILADDNNGQETVAYFVEPGDGKVFQGSDSAFWTLIWENYQDELRDMMVRIMQALERIAARKGLTGAYLHESVLNVLGWYFFGQSARYFPALAYQEDRKFGYVDTWYHDKEKAYNGVYPLTQALGDRYQSERLWIERRIVYLFSKYRIGAFTGATAGWGEMSFTLKEGNPFEFHITPAVALYPVGSIGGGVDVQGGRTMAGEEVSITLTSSGQTTNYIKGVDWIESLGDLSGLVLSSRSTDDADIAFSVVSARMRELIVGSDDAAKVKFNANRLGVSGPAMTVVDARNVTTLNSGVDLGRCPRLRKALFAGSTATGLLLPVGSRVAQVSMPENASTLFLHSLNMLGDDGFTASRQALGRIQNYYFNSCAQLNPLTILADMLQAGDVLRYVTMVWSDEVTGDGRCVSALLTLAQGTYGSVTYEDGALGFVNATGAVVRGKMFVDSIIEQDYDIISAAFPELQVAYDKKTLAFEDRRVWEICAYNWGEVTDKRGEAIASGELTGAGDEEVTGDFVFACGTQIPARTGQAAVAARAVKYRVELEGLSAQPWDMTGIAGESVVMAVRQFGNATDGAAAATYVGATAADYSALTYEDGKWYADFTATSAAVYLQVVVRAAAGVKVRWRLVAAADGTTACWQPVGITKEQCADVSSLGTVFYRNTLIGSFNELVKFTAVSTIGSNAFMMSSIENITIPSWVTSLEQNAFRESSAVNVIIHDGNMPLTIKTYGFYRCLSLPLIDIPSRVTTMAGFCFYGCSSLGAILMRSATPPEIGNNIFPSCYIYVPDDSLETYRTADKWSSYASSIKPLSEYGAES